MPKIFRLYKIVSFVIYLVFTTALAAQSKNTLDYFLAEAEKNSPVLNDYNNQIISNKIDSLMLRSTYGFIVTGEGSGLYAPVVTGWGYDNAISNGQSVFAGIRVAKEFISRNNLNTRLTAYNASIAQALAQAGITKQTLRKQIADQYIATYSGQQQMQVAQEIIRLLNNEDTVLKKITQAGVFKQTDYLSFKVTLQQNQLSLQQRTAEWRNNYALLNYLSGIADTAFEPLEPPVFAALEAAPFNESIYAASFKADSMKIANDKAIINYDYRPKINAFSDAGYQSSFIYNAYKNFGMSIGLSISLPVYDGNKKNMLLRQNNLTMQTRQKYLDMTQKQYEQQKLQIHDQIKLYAGMIQTAGEQMIYAKTLIEANAKQLPTGDVHMVDFILSINNLLNLKSNIIQYTTMLFNLQNQLQNIIVQ
ncbi:MAG: TolC family protein [Chitinophagaceae bacterium]|jgi:outer membrane protein TolC|nr:TolC family protein [Chitinophagaceae bacterium]